MLARDEHSSLFVENVNYVTNLVTQNSIFLPFYFMLVPFVGETDSSLEMLAREEHTSLFLEIAN
jgi:hypothetical protein